MGPSRIQIRRSLSLSQGPGERGRSGRVLSCSGGSHRMSGG
jgi:hypothetical protein